MASWINADAMMHDVMAMVNKEMQVAAEPIIRKAVEDAEKEMRKRLGVMFVSLIESSFSMERYGNDLRILVKQDDRRG